MDDFAAPWILSTAVVLLLRIAKQNTGQLSWSDKEKGYELDNHLTDGETSLMTNAIAFKGEEN